MTPASSTAVIAHPSQCRPGAPAVTATSPALLIAGQELVALAPPLGLLVKGPGREAPERSDDRAVERARRRGDLGSRWLVHEGHELVGEAGHRARDADAADVRAAADA